MPDHKETTPEHLTVAEAAQLFEQLSDDAYQVIVTEQTLDEARRVLSELNLLREWCAEKVAANPHDADWQRMFQRFEEAERFFEIGKVLESLLVNSTLSPSPELVPEPEEVVHV